MKKLLVVLLSVTLAVGCSGCNRSPQTETTESEKESVPETVTETEVETEEAEEMIDLQSGTPWIDSELIGAVTADTETNIKDDYALVVNKDWILTAQLPAGYSHESSITDVCIINDARYAELLTMENTDDDPYLAQVQSLYQLFLDWDSRNEAGVSPILPILDQLESIETLDDLTAYYSLSLADRYNCDYTPASVSIGFGKEDASTYIIDILSQDLLADDSAEYENPTEYGQMLLDARLDLARKVLGKAGYTEEEIDSIEANALTYEKLIASSIYTSDEQQDADYEQKINNKVTVAELKAQEVYPLVESLAALGVNTDDSTEVLLYNPAWLTRLNEIYTEENVPYFRDEMILLLAFDQAQYLDEECYGWYEEYNQTINGTTQSASLESQAASLISETLVWPMTRAYCQAYVTQEDKDRIYNMCEDIIAEYKEMIQSEDWLSQETKDYACDKLDCMQVFALYPDDDRWPETAEFDFQSPEEGGLYWDAMNSIRATELEYELGLAEETFDRTVWEFDVNTMEVNASNMPNSNAIYIYAGIAQGSFYHTGMSDAELYASMGTIIGHEISHAFDSAGSQYDKTGNLANWWTDEDLAAFNDRNQKMADYYSTISPWEGVNVHGSIVTGEAGADMAGVKVMLRLAEQQEDFDYDLFFRTYADFWKSYSTRQREESCLRDTHPLSYLRINVTLAQFDEFDETYGIGEGDGMYIAPEDRVIVW